MQVVQNYAKQQRYDLVLADGFIYANPALDITPAILSGPEVAGAGSPPRSGGPRQVNAARRGRRGPFLHGRLTRGARGPIRLRAARRS